MQTTLRPFVPDDYPAIAEVFNASWPGYPATAEHFYEQDEATRHYPGATFQRYVIESAGRIVAFGEYDQPPRFYRPHVFRVNIFVHPQYQAQGLGSTLYQRIIEDMRTLQGQTIWGKLREDMSSGIRFAEKLDFYEELRVREVTLDVAAFDPVPHIERITHTIMQGITIKTLQELATDEQRNQKLYDLIIETGSDLPATEHWNKPDYERFLGETLKRIPDCYFVALHQDDYVGVSYLNPHRELDVCYQGFTGVRRAYRRQGVALALKVCAIAYAKEHAYQEIRTSIDVSNLASLAVNQELGFVKQEEWVVLTKDLIYTH